MADHAYQPVADDNGPSQIAIVQADGRVVVMLPEEMQWIGLTPVEAVHLAMALMRHAIALDPSLEDGLPDNDTPLVN